MNHEKIFGDFATSFCLKKLNSLLIGGPARFFIEVCHPIQMQQVLTFCHQKMLPFFILGKGSNTLFDDRGFNGLVIANRIDFFSRPQPNLWKVGAGYSFSLLGTQSAREGWTGLEFASGIPASVGGAIFMNAGANGKETCQSLHSVDFISSEGEFFHFPVEQLHFDYRFSSFQKLKGAIVSATFSLRPSSKARQEQIKLIRYRTKTQPYSEKSAGCAFRNPSHISAGALIDQLGLKGKKIGDAEVSQLHGNFFINSGNASAKEMQSLFKFIEETVKKETGMQLQREVRFVPFEENTFASI